jgi:hypothetical protein
MTLARQMVDAVLRAQAKLRRMANSARESLVKQRDDLERLSLLTVDEEGLALESADASAAGESLKQEVARLRSRRDEVKAQLDLKLREAYHRLTTIHESKAREIRDSTISSDLLAALRAFSKELERMNSQIDHAPIAQQLRQIPLLARAAAGVRASVANEARAASRKLEKSVEVADRYRELADEDRQLRVEWEGLRKRLQQHYSAGETGILEDLDGLDRRLARRLRQEILVPTLRDARIEREKGLIGIDPLSELRSLL